MKNYIIPKVIFVTFVVCVCAFVSCEDDWEAPYLEIKETEYSVSNVTNEIVIPLETNYNWKVVSQVPSWITIEKTEGYGAGDLFLNVAANNSYARSCELIVAACTATNTITIEQVASTSGNLVISDEDCIVGGRWGNYQLLFSFKLKNPHLASKAGIEINGKKYQCSGTPSSYNKVDVAMNVMSVNGMVYRAYAVNRVTGKYVYGNNQKVKEY